MSAKRWEGARELLDVLKSQNKHYFRDLITGYETWVGLDMKLRTVWLSADAELPVRVKRTIASEKRILMVFWGT
jgi:hypothetical protein